MFNTLSVTESPTRNRLIDCNDKLYSPPVADPGFANGGPRSSAEGASIEAPRGEVWGGGAPSPENFSILSLKMATFSAFWALFLQFIVYSSMDCLKRFGRQKPLLVGKLAVVCMQIALGGKTSVLETTL